MTEVDELAAFVTRARYGDMSESAREQLKIRVLDSLGCALGALDAAPIRAIRVQLADFGGKPLCTLIGGSKAPPDRAAFYNGALVRYLDYMDSYLAKCPVGHPECVAQHNWSAAVAKPFPTNFEDAERLAACGFLYCGACRCAV